MSDSVGFVTNLLLLFVRRRILIYLKIHSLWIGNRMSQLIFTDQELSTFASIDVFHAGLSPDSGRKPDFSYQDSALSLSEIVNEIRRHPDNLAAHVQRIFRCYRDDLVDPLYAALVDFFIVLNKRGQAISRRMLGGSLAKLSDRQGALLKAALTEEMDDVSLLEGNRYSLFCRGLSGTVQLIEKLEEQKINGLDPLKLARDAVEYCQLEEAMHILESAIEEQPQPPEVHQLLLELYESTQNQTRFESVLTRLQHRDFFKHDPALQKVWDRPKDYFEPQYHE